MRILRALLVAGLVAVIAPACTSGRADTTRTVLTDYDFDEFPTSVFGFFPHVVSLHAGDTVDFKQAWTGEPHTVTLGTAVQPLGRAVAPYLQGNAALTFDYPTALSDVEQQLPHVYGDNDSVNQTAAAPCYVDRGSIPTNGKRCPKTRQPAFNGRQVFYNSGFIRYTGNNGNRFKINIARDTAPGSYFFYCLLHGATMGGYLDVQPQSVPIPSQATVNRQARTTLDAATPRLRQARDQAKTLAEAPGADIVAGAFTLALGAPGGTPPIGLVNEFVPSAFHAKVGQKVTWAVPEGPGHTVSFKVPKYLPVLTIAKDGTAKLNPDAYAPHGGSPTPPRNSGSDNSLAGSHYTQVDAGTYDGSRFLSSGYPDGPILYSVTFTKPGTYNYACLVHPRMVASVIVSA